MDFTHLKLNTPLQNYPETINNNFMLLGNTIDNFYISNDKIKEFKLNKNTDLKTLKNRKIDKGVLISPVYNTSVNSEIGTFNILQSNKLTVGTIITNNIPNFVKYSKLDVNYFYIDDDGVVSINRELFDKDFENINLIWHDSKNNNLLVGEIALDSQTIKISEDIRDTNIFGDESFKKLEEGNNNINIGNNNVVKSSSANNNVLICNNYNTDNINPHNYNIIIGSSDNYQNKNDNNFILGFTDKPFMSGDIEKGILKLDNINSELHMQRDIVILSDNKQLSNEFDSKEFININIGDNILGEGFNQSSGNIIIGSGNDVPNELNNSIIIGNNISDFYDVYNNSLILGNNNTDIPYIVAYNDEDNYPKEEYGTSNVVNVNGFLNLQYTNFAPTGTMVGIDADGNLCKLVSSKKYKKNIIPVLKSEQLYDFTPVLYEDINETSGNQYYGFIAEDIEKIDNKLVTYTNKDGNKELNSVSYERITVLLVAELQKQKKLIEELQSKIK